MTLSGVGDRAAESSSAADDDHELASPGHGGIEQIPLQHDVVLVVEHDDHGGILAALGLVDGARVGGDDVVEIVMRNSYRSAVKPDDDLGLLLVEELDPADVAVEDLEVVVVADLHDLVADAESLVAIGELRTRRGQYGLEFLVESSDSELAPVHRREHLDVVDRVEVIASGNPAAGEIDRQGWSPS